jgi:hypothetical protein
VHPRRAPVRAEKTGEQAGDVVGEYHVQQPHCPSPFSVQAGVGSRRSASIKAQLRTRKPSAHRQNNSDVFERSVDHGAFAQMSLPAPALGAVC